MNATYQEITLGIVRVTATVRNEIFVKVIRLHK